MEPLTRLILILESNRDHARLIESGLNESSLPTRQIVIANGLEATRFLQRAGDYADAPRPDLILLDLDLPDKDGRLLLEEIKSDPKLKRIPIVVLTTSDRPEDVLNSYVQQGNCYVVKATNLEQLFQIVKRIQEFWLGIVTLPLE